MSVRSRRSTSALAMAATVTACLVAAAIPATPALGDETRTHRQARTIHVSGLLALTNATKGEYDVTGDLVGKWTIPPTRATDYYNTPTTLLQKGTESFDGCLANTHRCGTLNSDYISWSYLKPSGRLISGGCVHAPTGGTQGFRGVRGLLVMTDTPVGADINTLYQGEIILDAKPEEKPMPVPNVRVATNSSSAKAAAGSC